MSFRLLMKLHFFCFRKALNIIVKKHSFKNVNNCLNTNIYSYLEICGGKSHNLNVVHFSGLFLTRKEDRKCNCKKF